ncbi:citrate synthase [Marinibaculum pumilum]|uniref:citrate synthase (unknown stereospecificity) n=1 Tax=Marinibaculum pumilum TaxID=1766165 RepID=A0ABV7LAE8_9PROT
MAGGLDDVVVARTALSHVDGAGGRLTIAGMPLETLADRPLEAVAGRLWQAAAGAAADGAEAAGLGAGRQAAWWQTSRALAAGRDLPPMEGLIAAMAAIGPQDGGADAATGASAGPDAEACRLAGAVAVFLPALLRQAAGLAPVAPRPDLPQAADLLRMLRDAAPAPAEADALNRYLVTVSDHGMNASTFTARVVASTRAGMSASVLAALCALKGPLHGGAPGPVLDMLDTVAAQPDARAWVRAQLAAGERIMGFGHRVYRVRDPRADVLRAAAAGLQSPRLAAAAALEEAVLAELAAHRPGRRLETNVEYMTAILLDALALPREAFTALFAAGRVVGWTAHVIEQERTGRLIRPQSDYAAPGGS